MLKLPADMQLLILDYITLPSHLKALCLVCKYLHCIATPRLYKKIVLNTWLHSRDIDVILKCVDVGARKHLKATQNLTLLNIFQLPEVNSALPNDRRTKGDYIGYEESSETMVSITDKRIGCLLDCFPRDHLRTFRYLAEDPLGESVLGRLRKTQSESLRNLHIAIGNVDVLEQFNNLHTVDLSISRSFDTTSYERLEGLFTDILNSSTLERLCLSYLQIRPSNSYMISANGERQSPLVAALQGREAGPIGCKALKELSLSYCLLGSMTGALLKSVDFERLARLDLWGCDGLRNFMAAIMRTCQGRSLNLTHLGLDLLTEYYPEQNQLLDAFLSLLPKLQGLRLKWKNPSGRCDPSPIINNLATIGSTLRTLSLGIEDKVGGRCCSDTLPHDPFIQICLSCPGLQELTYSVDERSIHSPHKLGPFLAAISQLKGLKTLRLIQTFKNDDRDFILLLGDEAPEFTATARTYIFQDAANYIFNTLSGHALQALILGPDLVHMGSPDHTNRSRIDAYTLRHCYMRGVQRDLMGRSTHVGIPVPSYILRHEATTPLMDWHPVESAASMCRLGDY